MVVVLTYSFRYSCFFRVSILGGAFLKFAADYSDYRSLSMNLLPGFIIYQLGGTETSAADWVETGIK